MVKLLKFVAVSKVSSDPLESNTSSSALFTNVIVIIVIIVCVYIGYHNRQKVRICFVSVAQCLVVHIVICIELNWIEFYYQSTHVYIWKSEI